MEVRWIGEVTQSQGCEFVMVGSRVVENVNSASVHNGRVWRRGMKSSLLIVNSMPSHSSAFTHHDSIPPVSSGITAQKRNSQLFLEDYIFTIPDLVGKHDFVALERIHILQFPGTTGEQ